MNIPIDKFEEWLRNKNLKERTIENYIYYFNKFTFNAFNQESISKFLSLKSNRNMVGRSFLVNLQKFLAVNYKELGFSRDIKIEILEVELPKITGRTKKRLIKTLTKEEILLLVEALPTEKLKLQALLTYYCGLRLGELLKISIMSFDWEAWKKDPSAFGECNVYGKGDKEGIAIVPPELMKRTARYIRANNFNSVNSKLFIRENNRKVNIDNRGRLWRMRLREAGIKAGITKLDDKRKPIKDSVVNPHKLRHSLGRNLRKEGLDIMDIKDVLRHSSVENTQIYAELDKEHIKKKLKNLGK